MKKKNIFILGIIMLFSCLFVSCATNKKNKINYDGLTMVTFELEGGSYRSSPTSVKHYYDLKDADSILIYELVSLTGKELTRPEYEFSGWFKTKKVVGDMVTYEDEWEFGTDKITKEGVTLYAYWKKKVNFAYNVCYRNDKEEIVVLGSYAVLPDEEETWTFEDKLRYGNKRPGFSAIGYLDEEGNPWDDTYIHQCDIENPVVNVFVDYIEGDYIIAREADDLIDAANHNVYLMNDIDMEGEPLSFGNYKYILEGNGHKIFNFTIPFSGRRADLLPDLYENEQNSLYLSLFGNMENAIVRNVTFENATLTISTTFSEIYKIYVSPIAISVTNSVISNVSYIGTINVTRLPAAFIIGAEGEPKEIDYERLVCANEQVYFVIDDKSKVENSTNNTKIENLLK